MLPAMQSWAISHKKSNSVALLRFHRHQYAESGLGVGREAVGDRKHVRRSGRHPPAAFWPGWRKKWNAGVDGILDRFRASKNSTRTISGASATALARESSETAFVLPLNSHTTSNKVAKVAIVLIGLRSELVSAEGAKIFDLILLALQIIVLNLNGNTEE